MEVPGLPTGSRFGESLSHPLINSQGNVAFGASLAQGGGDVTTFNDSGIWYQHSGGYFLVAREGDPAPGTPVGTNFSSLGILGFNDANHVALNARISTVESGTQLQSGFWSTSIGTLGLVARDFDPAPGGPTGSEFDIASTSTILMNSSGQISFQALLRSSPSHGVDSTNDEGIWSSESGALNLVVRQSDQAPGVPTGATFQRLGNARITNKGHTLFEAALFSDLIPGINGNNDDGIWISKNGKITQVVREGGQAPGLPMGFVFGSFTGRAATLFYTSNSYGHVAFRAGYRLNNSGGVGLWAQDATGDLRLILRTGDLFEVNAGSFRTISDIYPFSLGFNDNHQVLFELRFTDGTSGIFTAMLTVPEPSAILLATLCAATSLAGWQRRPGFAPQRSAALIERGASSAAK